MIKRRSAIEPPIGHMKMDGRLARNPLKGALGEALRAVMCGAGRNPRDAGRAAASMQPLRTVDAIGHRSTACRSRWPPICLGLRAELFRPDYQGVFETSSSPEVCPSGAA